ncbi:hypothetical protein T459_01103 [Capsicum annuum]|uniref:Ubiquitin-like protease family profile domain-containing protein n=1 Tax=Capsicum annuum TaxID=4072 RepID=A0A2G3AG57_CAPAN|nr:hypothetical protein FXO37_29345 [Capsicum annuum]PHT93221.1 hypothetical protein T459_01103 [Capsicum annuum]
MLCDSATDLMGDLVVKLVMEKSFDAFRKILREQKLDSYFRESYFGQYLDLPEENNARLQMKMVYDLLKNRFIYKNKDKMDEDPKVVDGIKMELFRATAITRKTILESGANDAPLTIFDTTNYYDYDHNDNPSDATLDLSVATYGQSVVYLYLALTILAFQVDVTVEATAEEHSITVHNPSTASKDEEKVEPISLGEQKNYPFKGFNISNEALRKLTQLINDYSEWITDGLLKYHVGFSILDGLPWHLINEVYIPINCGDKFHWVLAIVVLKERRIRFYNSKSRRRHFGPSSEIQKLAKILPTYLDMSGFLDQKVTDWSTIEA